MTGLSLELICGGLQKECGYLLTGCLATAPAWRPLYTVPAWRQPLRRGLAAICSPRPNTSFESAVRRNRTGVKASGPRCPRADRQRPRPPCCLPSPQSPQVPPSVARGRPFVGQVALDQFGFQRHGEFPLGGYELYPSVHTFPLPGLGRYLNKTTSPGVEPGQSEGSNPASCPASTYFEDDE